MILKSLEPAVNDQEYGEIYPRYSGQSLANVPHTITQTLCHRSWGTPVDEHLYGGRVDMKGIKKVVLLLLDGFGYQMWLDADSQPGFFRDMSRKGTVIPITSVFPSTTAAAVTTMSTGLTPMEHGLPEWVLYLHELGLTINTLPFTKHDSQKRVSLKDEGANPRVLFRGNTIYSRMSRYGVESYSLINRMIMNSEYTKLIRQGSSIRSFVYVSDGAIKLRELARTARPVSYIHMYMDTIDSVTHMYGPFTEESRATISSMSSVLKSQFLDMVDWPDANDTLVIVTADHGHTTIDPSKVVYLNGDRELMGMLATDRGRRIPPTGSPRGIFMHINKSSIDRAYAYLQKNYSGIARTVLTSDAIRMGLFGRGRPSKAFVRRTGDILLLPKDGEAIWYEHVKGRKEKAIGVHGGMTKNEMLVPLAMARLSDLA